MIKRYLPTLLVSLSAILLAACGGGGGGESGSSATLQSIAVTATNSALAVGASKQLNAMGTYSDDSTQDLTASVIWSSNATEVATVNSAGLVSASSNGTVVVTATAGTLSDQMTLTVTAPVATAVDMSVVSVLPLLPPLELVIVPPQGQTVTQQPQTVTLRPVADNTLKTSDFSGQDANNVIYADYANRVNSTGELVVGCAWSSTPFLDSFSNSFFYDVKKICAASLVKFDLGALAGKTILSAQLRLNVSGVGIGSNPQPWTVAAFASPWTSGSVTWNNAGGHGSYDYDRQWYLAPAYGGPTDLAVDRKNVVQAWVDGALPNHGFYLGLADYGTILTASPSNDAFAFFGSDDAQDRGPKLIVTYQ